MSFWLMEMAKLRNALLGSKQPPHRGMAQTMMEQRAAAIRASDESAPAAQRQRPSAAPPVRVVINPGHAPGAGGAPGAHINEADATGWVSDRVLPHSDDRVTWERLRQEGRDLNGLLNEARTNQRQIMVSLHFDAGSTTSRTAKIIYWDDDPDPVRRANSQRLGSSVGAALVQQGACDRYALQPAPYARDNDPDFLPGIVRDTATDAAILVEAGFITNPQTEAYVQTPEGQRGIADGLDLGVRNYLNGPPAASRPAPAQARPAPAGRGTPPAPVRPAPARPTAAPVRPAPVPRRAPGTPTPPQPPRDRTGRRGR